jgi:predicted nucleic acid-binding protein
MSADLVFVDTNVLLYAGDASEPEKQGPAAVWMKHLWQAKTGRISFQVLAEFYVNVTQKLKPGMPPALAQRNIRTLLAWRPLVIGQAVLEDAWTLQQQHKLSFWDALIAASAEALGCRYLLTEDLSDGQRIAGFTVLNPFQHGPDTLGFRARKQ